MSCKHERIRCTDNRFFCLDCGAEVGEPGKTVNDSTEKENSSEGAKKPVKRTRKKGDE